MFSKGICLKRKSFICIIYCVNKINNKINNVIIIIISRRFYYNPENEIVINYSSGHKSEPGWPFSRSKICPYLFSYRFSVGMRAAVRSSSFQKPRANSVAIGPENIRTSNTSNFLYQCYKVYLCFHGCFPVKMSSVQDRDRLESIVGLYSCAEEQIGMNSKCGHTCQKKYINFESPAPRLQNTIC